MGLSSSCPQRRAEAASAAQPDGEDLVAMVASPKVTAVSDFWTRMLHDEHQEPPAEALPMTPRPRRNWLLSPESDAWPTPGPGPVLSPDDAHDVGLLQMALAEPVVENPQGSGTGRLCHFVRPRCESCRGHAAHGPPRRRAAFKSKSKYSSHSKLLTTKLAQTLSVLLSIPTSWVSACFPLQALKSTKCSNL